MSKPCRERLTRLTVEIESQERKKLLDHGEKEEKIKIKIKNLDTFLNYTDEQNINNREIRQQY